MRNLGLLTALLFVLSATLSSASVSDSHTNAKLVSEVRSVQPGKPFWVAVRLTMDAGWHTYWRNPGDSGLPTKIKWTLPEGFENGEIQWPYPHKFGSSNIVSFGYKDEVFLLTEISPPKSLVPAAPVKIAATVEWLECKDGCVPRQADLILELPVKNAAPEPDSRRVKQFEETRWKLPLTSSSWQISAAGSKSGFILQLTPPPGLGSELAKILFFPEKGGIIDHAAEQEATKTETGHILKLKKSPYTPEPATRLRGVLVSSTGWRGLNSERALQVDIPVIYDFQVN